MREICFYRTRNARVEKKFFLSYKTSDNRKTFADKCFGAVKYRLERVAFGKRRFVKNFVSYFRERQVINDPNIRINPVAGSGSGCAGTGKSTSSYVPSGTGNWSG